MTSDISNEIEITLNAPATKVWQALTDPLIIKKYLFGTRVETDWQPGRAISFKGEYNGQLYEDKGTVLDVVAGKKLMYTYWSTMGDLDDQPENYMNLTYELEEQGAQTKLRLLQENIPDEKTKEHSAENWKKVLETMKDIIENGQP